MQKNYMSRSALQAATFAETTSAHGFAFFMASSSWLSKAFWLLLILFGCFLSIFFTAQICQNSLEPPFFSTEISMESTGTTSPPLPDIVLCDPSPWDLAKGEQHNISIQLLSYISYFLFPLTYGANITTLHPNFQELDKSFRTILAKFDNNSVYLLNNITKDCSQIVLFCLLGATEAIFSKECCTKIFSSVEYTHHYKCFSSGGTMKFTMEELSQDFGISIFTKENYIKLKEDIASGWSMITNGIAVAVADPKSNLYYVSKTKMNLLASNTHNSIAVERKELDSSDKDSDFLPYKERIF